MGIPPEKGLGKKEAQFELRFPVRPRLSRQRPDPAWRYPLAELFK